MVAEPALMYSSLPSERVFLGAIAAALIAASSWYVMMSQRAPVHRRAPVLQRNFLAPEFIGVEFFASVRRSLDDDHATLAAAALAACVLFLAVCASPAAQALSGPFTLEAYRAAPDSHRYVELQLLDGLHLTRTPTAMTKDILFRDVPLLSLAAAVREFAAEEPLPLTAEEPTRFTVLLRADRLGDASSLRTRETVAGWMRPDGATLDCAWPPARLLLLCFAVAVAAVVASVEVLQLGGSRAKAAVEAVLAVHGDADDVAAAIESELAESAASGELTVAEYDRTLTFLSPNWIVQLPSARLLVVGGGGAPRVVQIASIAQYHTATIERFEGDNTRVDVVALSLTVRGQPAPLLLQLPRDDFARVEGSFLTRIQRAQVRRGPPPPLLPSPPQPHLFRRPRAGGDAREPRRGFPRRVGRSRARAADGRVRAAAR